MSVRARNWSNDLKVTALAGGVGGAKMLVGLQEVLRPGSLTAIVNTGDDFWHYGLRISPDLDSVCYALAELADPQRGWGRRDESWRVLSELRKFGAPDWFSLGDLDLAWHLERQRLLSNGQTLSQVTAHFCKHFGIATTVLPMVDEPAPTLIKTKSGDWLGFQDYFVRLRCEPDVAEFALLGGMELAASPEVRFALDQADLVVITPSNPWVSIDPILALGGVRDALMIKTVVAVSPIIQGNAVKGPAAKMFSELGITPSSLAVRQHYEDVLDVFVFDQLDLEESKDWPASDIINHHFQTVMKTKQDRMALAEAVISLGVRVLQQK